MHIGSKRQFVDAYLKLHRNLRKVVRAVSSQLAPLAADPATSVQHKPTHPYFVELIASVADAVSGSGSLRARLKRAGQRLMSHVQYDGFSFYLPEPSRKRLKLFLACGQGNRLIQNYGRNPKFHEGFAGRVIVSGRPIYAANFDEIAELVVHPALKRMGVRTFASIPLNAKGKAVGVLNLGSSLGHEISQAERRVLEAVGNILAATIENERLLNVARQSEIEYQSLFEEAPDIYLTVDENGRISDCNRTGELLLGASRSSLKGKAWTALIASTSMGNLMEEFHQVAIGKKNRFSAESALALAGGASFEVSIAVNALANRKGRTAFRVAMRDISNVRALERHLQRAQRMESLGTLAGGVAHDFNNLLTGILFGVGELEVRQFDDPKLASAVEVLSCNVKRAHSLVNDLMTFARGAEGERSHVDPGRLTQSSLQLVTKSLPESICTEVRVDGQLPRMDVAAGQIEQVLINLCLNARDAMPEGGTLSIQVSRDVLGNGESAVCIQVADTGTGIAPHLIDRVFEPFFTTKPAQRGSGLGLAIAYNIVRRHGGDIRVESSPGEGTRFQVLLPAAGSGD